jgi:hypothetical protein
VVHRVSRAATGANIRRLRRQAKFNIASVFSAWIVFPSIRMISAVCR